MSQDTTKNGINQAGGGSGYEAAVAQFIQAWQQAIAQGWTPSYLLSVLPHRGLAQVQLAEKKLL